MARPGYDPGPRNQAIQGCGPGCVAGVPRGDARVREGQRQQGRQGEGDEASSVRHDAGGRAGGHRQRVEQRRIRERAGAVHGRAARAPQHELGCAAGVCTHVQRLEGRQAGEQYASESRWVHRARRQA